MRVVYTAHCPACGKLVEWTAIAKTDGPPKYEPVGVDHYEIECDCSPVTINEVVGCSALK